MKNKSAFLPIRVHLCSIAAFLMSKSHYRGVGNRGEQIRFGKAIYLLPVPIGSLLFVASQYTRRFCARVDGMPPCCLATGRWGAARRRLDTGIAARDPAPCPLSGLMKNRQVDMTKIKSLLQKRQTSLCPGHEWLAIVVLWFHWNVFILDGHFHFWTKKQCKKWFGPRVGLVLSRVHKLSYAKKKFFCSWNFLCEKFPIKHCSTHNMWILWSFRSISSSYFHRNIMYIWIFAHPRLTTYQLDCTRMLYKRK